MDRLLISISFKLVRYVIKKTKNKYDDKLLAHLENLIKEVLK